MIQEIPYRLGRYKIIEGPGNVLEWESHTGFGSIHVGRCFIEGNILIIGPAEGEQPGPLKREFMEHLDKSPAWEKTKYYCSSQFIHKSKTGQRLSFRAEAYKRPDLYRDGEEGRIFSKIQKLEPILDELPRRGKMYIFKDIDLPKGRCVKSIGCSNFFAGMIGESSMKSKMGQIWHCLEGLLHRRFR